MVVQKKLIVVIAGLSLGACSSIGGDNNGKNSFMSYETMQNKIRAHDESLQNIQNKLDRVDALESEVASLKQDQNQKASSKEVMNTSDSALSPEETLINIDDVAPMKTSANAVTPETSEGEAAVSSEPAPMMTEKTQESSMETAPMMESAPIMAAPMSAQTTPAPATQKTKTMPMQYGVQVASFVSRDKAIHGWKVLIDTFPTRYNGLVPLINQKEVNTRLMNQLKVGPFENRASAAQFCMTMKKGGQDCLVTKYNGDTF